MTTTTLHPCTFPICCKYQLLYSAFATGQKSAGSRIICVFVSIPNPTLFLSVYNFFPYFSGAYSELLTFAVVAGEKDDEGSFDNCVLFFLSQRGKCVSVSMF